MKRALIFLLMMVSAAADDQPTLVFKPRGNHVSLAVKPGANPANAAAKPAGVVLAEWLAIHAAQVRVQAGGGLVISGASPVSSTPPASREAPTLRWKNGETLRGEIAAASATGITWRTPLFEDPLQLRWEVINRIEWPVTAPTPTGPFGIVLRDGSFLYGDITAMSADSISIHAARHGDAVLKRSEVLSAKRLQHGSLLYAGPLGDVGWQSMIVGQDGSLSANPFGPDFTPALVTGPGGALQISNWNRCSRMGITLPDSVEVEFRVSASDRPNFMLALGGTPHVTLRIETWDNELVMAVGEDFKVLKKMEKDEHEVALRVCWDKKTQRCAIYTTAGDLIADWKMPGNITSTAPGIVVENKGLNLLLDQLQVREWDGKPPAKIDPKQELLELADGRRLGGKFVPGAPGAVHFLATGQTAAVDFPIAEVDAMQFSTDSPQVTDHEATLRYNDGSILYGRLDSIGNGTASLATSFTEKLLPSQMDLLRQLLIHALAHEGAPPDKPLADLDKIVIAQTTLHGTLGMAADHTLGWIPVGGVDASRPAPAFPSVITRSFPEKMPAMSDTALFYLASGDILPGNLGSLDKSGAEFASSLMGSRKIPAGEINAIKFGAPTRLEVKGFKDPGWQIVRGDENKIRRPDDDTMQMDAGTALGFPSLMQSSEISFKLISNGLSAIRLRMFCSRTDSSHSTNLLLGSTGNQFISGLETTQGQFDNQAQIKTTPGDPVNVRLEIGEDQVELFVNDISQQRFPIDPTKLTGSGLVIEPAGLWGNNSFAVSLAGFSAHSGAGRIWLPDVSDDVRNQALTVPRFQKDDPPRHLLLADNGDVLRGEVEAATATHLGFRSGMDELNVPRDRIDALIWLKPPAVTPVAGVDPSQKPPASPLERPIEGRMLLRQLGLSQLVAFLESQDGDLKIKLPETVLPLQISVMIAGQSVGELLGTICSRFDLRYNLDPDGTVVLSPQTGSSTNELVSKCYWVNPGAIPQSPAIEGILLAKGITFSKEASASWDSAAGLLSMTNTLDNQTRLVDLIASDFGGGQGAPTHWLQLAGGGRLALQVDKIGPDFITGHHPVYGEVKVPLAQVYMIRTTAPKPSAAIKSLENWRLVDAPEPVLPEGSGETSPLLGKDAATFSLPLLAGGAFDLADQKGHVVVLDFWATWCGPCVKSLPGLIDAVAGFPADKVRLIGVNQGEAGAQVTHFLELRGLKLEVALDADQSVGQKYGADAIPQTVIIGPDGKVAWVQTGYSEEEGADVSDTIRKLLAATSAANTSPDKSAQ